MPSPMPPETDIPAPTQPVASKSPLIPGTSPAINWLSGVYAENPAT